MNFDKINRPEHYADKDIEVIDYIKDTLTPEGFEGYCIGNVIKYISRYRKKGGLEDLQKALYYLSEADKLLAEIEAEADVEDLVDFNKFFDDLLEAEADAEDLVDFDEFFQPVEDMFHSDFSTNRTHEEAFIHNLATRQLEFKQWYDNMGLIAIDDQHVHLTHKLFTELFRDDFTVENRKYSNTETVKLVHETKDGVKFIALLEI